MKNYKPLNLSEEVSYEKGILHHFDSVKFSLNSFIFKYYELEYPVTKNKAKEKILRLVIIEAEH